MDGLATPYLLQACLHHGFIRAIDEHGGYPILAGYTR